MDALQTSLLARLRAEFPDSSGRRLRAWLAAGRVRVKGEIVRDPRTPVLPADPVTLGPAPPPALAAPLRLVHEDESLLVIEKPPGLLTIGTEHERERTAYRMVWAYLKGARPSRRPFIVHRLDRETSGLLVIAKTPETKQYLQAQFFSGTAERRYVAIVEGVVTADEGTLRDVLVEERSLRVRPADPTRPPPKGRRARIAITRYRVVERRADVTRVALRLGTGRRHQIRVQMAKLGHPVVGDVRHGARRDPLRRLCLHATRLGFRHPETGMPVEFDCAPPAAFGTLGRPADRATPTPAPRPERDARDAVRRVPESGRRPSPTSGAPRPSPAGQKPPRPPRGPERGARRAGPPGWRPPRAGPGPRPSWTEGPAPPPAAGPDRGTRDVMRRPSPPGRRPARYGPGPRPSSAEGGSSSPPPGPDRGIRDATRRPPPPGRRPARYGPGPRPSSAEGGSSSPPPGPDRGIRDATHRPPPPPSAWRLPRGGPSPRPPRPWSAERRSSPRPPGPERDARDEMRRPAPPGRDAIRGPAEPGWRPPRGGPAPDRWPRGRRPRRPPR